MADPTAALDALPRHAVLTGPTPLQRWRRFGGWAKRDDLTPVLLGGNKVRKLELLVGAALAEGADSVVTYGALQSNHCAQTAAVARTAGLHPVLCLRGEPQGPPRGNLLLDRLLGAEIRLHPGPHDVMSRARWLGEVAGELRESGRRPFLVPYGGSSPLGALGYALAGRELQAQLDEAGIDPPVVVVTSSSGGTQAGLVVAGSLGWLRAPVLGVSADLPAAELAPLVHDLAVRAAALLGAEPPPVDLVEVDDTQVGEGYAVPTPASRRVARRLLEAEGVLTDQVYTAKGLAGFAAVLERAPDALFWHTGGLAGVFAEEHEPAGDSPEGHR